jgi:Rnl2 family RNA ligase
MQFVSFNDIENVQRQKYIDKVQEEGHGNKEFCVTEKAHGCSLSLVYDGTDFRMGSRSQFIGSDSNFYGINPHIETLKSKMIKLYENLGNTGLVRVFGEWMGGRYPEMVSPAGTKQVQKEVVYCPHNEFYAFHLIKDDKYFSVDERNEQFEKVGFIFAKILFRGKLDECLKYPNMFVTTIPEYFGLPKIEGNICEGTVIEPTEVLFNGYGSRIIFKNKNEKFKEGGDKVARVKEDVDLGEVALERLNWLLGCVNENRRNAVVSKFDNLTDKQFGPLMGKYIQDIVDEYRKEFEQEIGEGLDGKEEKKVKTLLSKAVQEDIRADFANIIDRFKI